MTKEDNEDFKDSTKRWIYDNDYVDNDVKARDHCNIIGKHTDPAHKGCNMNLKLNGKTAVVFYNLKHYNSHLILRELGTFIPKINVKMSYEMN